MIRSGLRDDIPPLGCPRRDKLCLVFVVLGFLLPALLAAQGTFPYLVKIHGTPRPGSGFVVAHRGSVATVVTAAHVIMGASKFEVAFAVAPGQRFTVDSSSDVIGMQTDEIHGLAAFWVRGALPAQVTALTIDAETTLGFDEDRVLAFVGYPNQARSPRRVTGRFAGREGVLLLVDRSVGRGASGGPLLLGGRAVGLVTATDDQVSYAVSSVVVLEALKGWNVNLGAIESPPSSVAVPPSAPVRSRVEETCSFGEEREENGIVFVRICAGDFMMGSEDGDGLRRPGTS